MNSWCSICRDSSLSFLHLPLLCAYTPPGVYLIFQISKNGTVWLEPMREFVNCALQAQKIARAKNNCHDLAIMAKKVGSNLFLMNRRLSANLNYALAALSAPPSADSPAPTSDSISKIVSRQGFEP